jgi:hypothetical protein
MISRFATATAPLARKGVTLKVIASRSSREIAELLPRSVLDLRLRLVSPETELVST